MKKKANKYCTLYLKGGLGNQLFQYATAYSYTKKYKKKLKINIDQYINQEWEKETGFVLDKIISDINILPLSGWTRLLQKNYFLKFLGRMMRKIFLKKGLVFEEIQPYILQSSVQDNGNYDGLSGYFQNPQYFEVDSKEIKSKIHLKLITKPSIELSKKIIITETSVALHYRDYSDPGSGNLEVREKMGEPDNDYYYKAIKFMKENTNDPYFFVFSNNIDSAKKKFKDFQDLYYFNYKSDFLWEDMSLMSLCKNNIICNSSYSWWSAYLNPNKDKIVVAPKKWDNFSFTDPCEHLYPPGWIKF